jgi:hypothetical protein
MRNLTYILPLCLCCFAVLGHQQKADRSTLRSNPGPSQEMLGKYKQHEGWVKLTAEIDRETPIANKLRSHIKAQNEVIVAKHAANKDTSNDQRRLAELEKSLRPLSSGIAKMESQRKVIEAEIRMREANKQ